MVKKTLKLIGIITGLLQSTLVFSGEGFTSDAVSKKVIRADEVAQHCLSEKWTRPALIELKNNKFELIDSNDRTELAKQLMHCLASPDPLLRDGVAFTALSQWLRADGFSPSFYQAMFTQLIETLHGDVIDDLGIYQPFAALVLSEVVRVDRITPYLDDIQRQTAVAVISQYLHSLKDYRGFDDKIGWRHGIAHSADVMLQLALNPAINKTQLEQMLEVLADKVNPDKEHFYIYGEPQRISMAVVYIFLKNQHTVSEWENWLAKVTNSQPLASWGEAYQSQQGLAKLHNTQSFLRAFYALIKTSKNETLIQMVPALEKALQQVN